jgi:hypothetical protein
VSKRRVGDGCLLEDIQALLDDRCPSAEVLRDRIAVMRKALTLPVELLGFFGNLYLDPVLFCNTSTYQPRLAALPEDCQAEWCTIQWSGFGIAHDGDGLA